MGLFPEACGVGSVDEQYPAPPWFLSTLELHGLFFFFSITLSSKYLHQCSTMAAGLSSGTAFQISRQKSGEMICGDLGGASHIQSPFMNRFSHIQAS